MKRTGHTWRWGMLQGTSVRRTEVVRLRWVVGRDGPIFVLAALPPLVATFAECEACGLLCAEAELTDLDGAPRRIVGHGYSADTLLVGPGVPACAPGQLSRDYPRAVTAERSCAA